MWYLRCSYFIWRKGRVWFSCPVRMMSIDSLVTSSSRVLYSVTKSSDCKKSWTHRRLNKNERHFADANLKYLLVSIGSGNGLVSPTTIRLSGAHIQCMTSYWKLRIMPKFYHHGKTLASLMKQGVQYTTRHSTLIKPHADKCQCLVVTMTRPRCKWYNICLQTSIEFCNEQFAWKLIEFSK